MQGSITQAAALVLFGNDVLKGQIASGWWPEVKGFKFCRKVVFSHLSGSGPRVERTKTAGNPDDWLTSLQQSGVEHLSLRFMPSEGTTAVSRLSTLYESGEGRWVVLALRSWRGDVWEARWEVDGRPDVHNRIWNVSYDRVLADAELPNGEPTGEVVLRRQLSELLQQSLQFARECGLTGAEGSFLRAVEVLDDPNPWQGLYHETLVPGMGIPLAWKQLHAAVHHSWVFSALGDWQVTGLSGSLRQKHRRLSRDLLDCLITVLLASSTAGFPGA